MQRCTLPCCVTNYIFGIRFVHHDAKKTFLMQTTGVGNLQKADFDANDGHRNLQKAVFDANDRRGNYQKAVFDTNDGRREPFL